MEILEKHVVHISRKWNNPRIFIDVDNTGIDIKMDLDEFVSAILEEIGSPALTITRTQLKNKIKLAVEEVCLEMKKQTTPVMS